MRRRLVHPAVLSCFVPLRSRIADKVGPIGELSVPLLKPYCKLPRMLSPKKSRLAPLRAPTLV